MNCAAALIYITDKCDYIPFVSTASNIVNIALKILLARGYINRKGGLSPYYTFIEKKNFKLMALLLIPIIGNLAAAIIKGRTSHPKITPKPPSLVIDKKPSRKISPSPQSSPSRKTPSPQAMESYRILLSAIDSEPSPDSLNDSESPKRPRLITLGELMQHSFKSALSNASPSP